MKKRFTLLLRGATLGGARTETVTFNYTLKKLLEWDKLYKLTSSFHTGDYSTGIHAGIEVGLNLPQGYNVNYSDEQYVLLGVADPTVVDPANHNLKYSFTESTCFPVMIDAPVSSPLVVEIYSVEDVALPLSTFTLHLAFEEL